jgi:Flp pilus assembly protein TadG
MKGTAVRRNTEKGQTLAIVAVSIVTLLGVGALAVDLTSLYSAREEIQRAADAAALAGAKAFVDSGVTTDNSGSRQSLAQTMAHAYATAALGQNGQNLVANGQAVLGGSPIFDFTLAGNPRITVTATRTGLPLFFARVWGNSQASVSATATAEAYNPAFSQTNPKGFVPSAPKCVKPFLVPNGAPPGQQGNLYVDQTTGAVNKPPSWIGQSITLTPACNPNQSRCVPPASPSGRYASLQPNTYLPLLLVSSTHNYCPNSSSVGCGGITGWTNFEQSIGCCDGVPLNSSQCGVGSPHVSWDPRTNPGGSSSPAQAGLQCLIHEIPQNPQQQDTLDPSSFSGNNGLLISPGQFSQNLYGVGSGNFISNSDSIITVPLFDNSNNLLPRDQHLELVGFLELFVSDAQQGGVIKATILNVVGCGNTVGSGAPVSGGGVSAIPVRLVQE